MELQASSKERIRSEIEGERRIRERERKKTGNSKRTGPWAVYNS